MEFMVPTTPPENCQSGRSRHVSSQWDGCPLLSRYITRSGRRTSSSSGLWSLLLVAWLVALLSSLSALFIGEVMGQAPCVLCWFQRAFMFPLTVILAIACYRSDFAIWRYALPLAGIGAGLALAHTLLYAGLIPLPIQPCRGRLRKREK